MFEQDVKRAVESLKQGGVILYPTDTIWGLGCNALDEKAIDKIFAIKHRPKEKSMIILLAEARDVLQYVAAPHPDIIDIVSSFEKPTTVIYPGALGFPDNLVQNDDTIAIRVTNDPFCKSLIKRLGAPLISTSANLSGEPSPKNYSDISEEVKQGVDYVVEYRREEINNPPASRIVTINEDGTLNIIRA